jgi:hypothetical protein
MMSNSIDDFPSAAELESPDDGILVTEEQQRASDETRRRLGIAKDMVRIGSNWSATGYNMAKKSTSFSFGATKAFLQASSHFLKSNEIVEEHSSVLTFLSNAEKAVGVAHSITETSLCLSEKMTLGTLKYANRQLELAGARDGELYRAIAHTVLGDKQYGDAIVAALNLFPRFFEGTSLTILSSLRPLFIMVRLVEICGVRPRGRRLLLPDSQEGASSTTVSVSSSGVQSIQRPSSNDQPGNRLVPLEGSGGGDSSAADGSDALAGASTTPTDARNRQQELEQEQDARLLRDIVFYHPLVVAAAGGHMLRLQGIIPLTSSFETEEDCISYVTKLPKENILYNKLSTDTVFMSGLYIIAVHEKKELCVVFRGTSNVHEILTDLQCETKTWICDAGKGDGSIETTRVHEGFLKTILSLDQTVLPFLMELRMQPVVRERPMVSHTEGDSSNDTANEGTSTGVDKTGDSVRVAGTPVTSKTQTTQELEQEGEGEVEKEDTLDSNRDTYASYKVVLLGYSFGAAVAGMLAVHWSPLFPISEL